MLSNTPSPLWLGPGLDARSLPRCPQTSGVTSAPAGGAQGAAKGGLTQDWKEEHAGVAWIREKDLQPPLQKIKNNHVTYTSQQGESLRAANHRTPEGRRPG